MAEKNTIPKTAGNKSLPDMLFRLLGNTFPVQAHQGLSVELGKVNSLSAATPAAAGDIGSSWEDSM